MKLTASLKRIPFWLKVLIVLILAVLILLGIGYAADRINKGKDVTVSSYSVEDEGLKGLYLSAEEYLGQQNVFVDRFAKSARFLPQGSGSLVFVSGGGIPIRLDSFEQQDLKNYLAGGGILVEVADSSALSFSLASLVDTDLELSPEERYGLTVIEIPMEQGAILCVASDGFSNIELKDDPSTGARILVLLAALCRENGIDTVLFNDYYAGVDGSSSADVLGYGMILAGVELVLCIVAFLFAVGGRFGAPEAVPELEKRSEQEPVQALAGMYERAGGGVNIFKVHMEALCDDLKHYLGLPDRTSQEDILAETREMPKLRALGTDALLQDYIKVNSGGSIALTKDILNGYIKKIDGIREELR